VPLDCSTIARRENAEFTMILPYFTVILTFFTVDLTFFTVDFNILYSDYSTFFNIVYHILK